MMNLRYPIYKDYPVHIDIANQILAMCNCKRYLLIVIRHFHLNNIDNFQ